MVDTQTPFDRSVERGYKAASLLRLAAPGVLVCVTIAIAAAFLSQHYNAPVMLFALLLGMAFHFLAQEGRCVAGIDFAARRILRMGVLLLGAQITFAHIGRGVWIPAFAGTTTRVLRAPAQAFHAAVRPGAPGYRRPDMRRAGCPVSVI